MLRLLLLEVFKLLEVKGLDKGIELIGGLIETVINESVSEKDRVVGEFDLAESILDTWFELLFGFLTGAQAATELLEGWWVDE